MARKHAQIGIAHADNPKKYKSAWMKQKRATDAAYREQEARQQREYREGQTASLAAPAPEPAQESAAPGAPKCFGCGRPTESTVERTVVTPKGDAVITQLPYCGAC